MYCYRTLLKQGPYGGTAVMRRVVIITPGSLVKYYMYYVANTLSLCLSVSLSLSVTLSVSLSLSITLSVSLSLSLFCLSLSSSLS